MEEKHCLLKEERPSFRHIIKNKIDALEEEKEIETKFFDENGLYNERDVSDIEDEIDVAKRVLKNLETVPECGKRKAS